MWSCLQTANEDDMLIFRERGSCRFMWGISLALPQWNIPRLYYNIPVMPPEYMMTEIVSLLRLKMLNLQSKNEQHFQIPSCGQTHV